MHSQNHFFTSTDMTFPCSDMKRSHEMKLSRDMTQSHLGGPSSNLLMTALATLIAIVSGMSSATHAIESVPVTREDSLESAMRDSAAEILRHCRANGIQNIGVLKFMVVKANRHGEISDNALETTIGTIHHSLARKLEVALLLGNSERDPVGIIDDASAYQAPLVILKAKQGEGEKANECVASVAAPRSRSPQGQSRSPTRQAHKARAIRLKTAGLGSWRRW